MQSVFDNMSTDEMDEVLVIVFIAEVDPDYVARIAAQVRTLAFFWSARGWFNKSG